MKKQVAFRLDEKEIDKLKIYVITKKTTIQKLLEDFIQKILKENEK